MPHTARVRTAAAMIAVVGLALSAAACSGGKPSASGSNGSHSPNAATSAVAYSQCVRSHGVPKFPDPPSGGAIAKASAQEVGVSQATLQAAESACQHLIPTTGGPTEQTEQQCFMANDCSPTIVRALLNIMLRFSRCMRSHGEPNFPDPTTGPDGQPFFDASAHGISDAASHTHAFIAKLNVCQRLVGNFPYTFG